MSDAKPPRDDVYRARGVAPTLTRSEGEGMPTMVVEWARYNEWTEINSAWEGRFLERIAPGAFDKTIAESQDSMRVLFDHGHDPSIGNKVLGPIQTIENTAEGVRGHVPLLDTTYNRDLIPGLEHGLYGASFRFSVVKEDFVGKPSRSDYNPNGLPERTLTEAKVREWGPVTFPAYAGASAGLRSITDEMMLARFLDDPERLEQMLKTLRKQDKPKVSVTINGVPASASVFSATEAATLLRDIEVSEPEPPAATTPEAPDIEPEPSEATTRSDSTNLFWFVKNPKH